MTGSIVVAVDGSREATEAARVAAMLARHLDRRLVLAHVADDPPVFPYGDSRRREIHRRHAMQRGGRLLDDVAMAIVAPVARKRVTLGGVGRGGVQGRLAALCSEEHADLMLLGSRTHGVVTRALFGDASLYERRTQGSAREEDVEDRKVAHLRAA